MNTTNYTDEQLSELVDVANNLKFGKIIAIQGQFQHEFGQEIFRYPYKLTPERVNFRMQLMNEELQEWFKAAARGDLKGSLDALGDLLVTLIGTAHAQGLGSKLGPAFVEIMRSNIAKKFPDGSIKNDENNKTLKPEGWTGPDLITILTKDYNIG